MNTDAGNRPIFICHNSEVSCEALALCVVLELAGYPTWTYEVDSASHADRDTQERELIEAKSSATIALLSKACADHPESIVYELGCAEARKVHDYGFLCVRYTVDITFEELLSDLSNKRSKLHGMLAPKICCKLAVPIERALNETFDLKTWAESDIFAQSLFQTDLRGLAPIQGPADLGRVRRLRQHLTREIAKKQAAECSKEGIGGTASNVQQDVQAKVSRIDKREGDGASRRGKWRWAFLLSAAVAIIGIVVYGALCGRAKSEFMRNEGSFRSAMPWIKWIVYDPSGEFDPTQGKYPSAMSVTRDMETLVQWGVKGVITTSSKGVLGQVPRIAKEAGIVMVIAGVWDPSDSQEVANTMDAARYVDAYCVGNQALDRGVSLRTLKKTMARVRRQTRKPVSFSERLCTYDADPALASLGDFLFPDSAIEWLLADSSTNAPRAITARQAYSETIRMAKIAAELCHDSSRLILLKMIGFPSAGHEGFTEETQAEFFQFIANRLDDDPNLPANIHLSFMTTFDQDWKAKEINWDPCERHVGLFRADRTPKRTAQVFRDWVIAK